MQADNMTVVVAGLGQMGRAIAWYVLTRWRPAQLVLVDRDPTALQGATDWLSTQTGTTRIEGVCHEFDGSTDAPRALCESTIAFAALPWEQTFHLISSAVGRAAPVVSITRPDYSQLEALKARAVANGQPVLLPMGLEPGLTEMLACEMASHFTEVQTLTIRCGGIPDIDIEPIGYKLLFNATLPIRPRPAFQIDNGLLQVAKRFDDCETFDIPAVGELEAHLDGMVPWLAEDARFAHVERFRQKTVRRKGFTAAVTTLERCGLLSGANFDVTERMLRAAIETVECGDITVLDVAAVGRLQESGEIASRRWLLTDASPRRSVLSSMARTTGFSAAIAGEFLLKEKAPAGWILPHQLIRGENFRKLIEKLRIEGIRFDSAWKIE